jgi:hypothetical protein
VTVSAVDQFGNTDTSATGTATFGSTDPQFVPANGALASGTTAPVTLSLRTVGGGSQTIVASLVTGAGTISGSSPSISVTPGTPSKLDFTTPPGTQTAGQPFGTTVAVEDAFGNAVGSAAPAGSVSLALTPTTGSLAGTTVQPTSSGGASFSGLSVAKANPAYTLAATYSAAGIDPASTPLVIAPGAPSKLVVVSFTDEKTQLGAPVQTLKFDVNVQAQDAAGNPVPLSTTAATPLSLTAAVPANLTNAGAGSIAAGATDGTIVGAIYSQFGNSVGLTVSTASPALSTSVTVQVQALVATANPAPGQSTTLSSLNPTGTACVLGATTPTCSTLVLSNGANSSRSVYLYEGQCSGVTSSCRTNGSLSGLLVTATFLAKAADGVTPLYTNTAPAKLVVGCYLKLCPLVGDNDNDLEDKTEDATAYPLFVNLLDVGGTYVKSPICSHSGQIDPGLSFCTDLSQSSRDSKHNLTNTILIVVDPHAAGH